MTRRAIRVPQRSATTTSVGDVLLRAKATIASRAGGLLPKTSTCFRARSKHTYAMQQKRSASNRRTVRIRTMVALRSAMGESRHRCNGGKCFCLLLFAAFLPRTWSWAFFSKSTGGTSLASISCRTVVSGAAFLDWLKMASGTRLAASGGKQGSRLQQVTVRTKISNGASHSKGASHWDTGTSSNGKLQFVRRSLMA